MLAYDLLLITGWTDGTARLFLVSVVLFLLSGLCLLLLCFSPDVRVSFDHSFLIPFLPFFVVFAPAGTQPSWASVRGVASPRVPAGFTRLGEPTRTPGQRDPGG